MIGLFALSSIGTLLSLGCLILLSYGFGPIRLAYGCRCSCGGSCCSLRRIRGWLRFSLTLRILVGGRRLFLVDWRLLVFIYLTRLRVEVKLTSMGCRLIAAIGSYRFSRS